eukprot:3936570-Rhodomonas_salina.1
MRKNVSCCVLCVLYAHQHSRSSQPVMCLLPFESCDACHAGGVLVLSSALGVVSAVKGCEIHFFFLWDDEPKWTMPSLRHRIRHMRTRQNTEPTLLPSLGDDNMHGAGQRMDGALR